MAKKQILFDFFRFQILPKSSIQFKMFDEISISYDELKARKNEFFMDVILNPHLTYSDTFANKLRHKIIFNDGDVVSMKLGKQKSILLTNEEFEDEEYTDFPSVFVIINNNHGKQKIAISRDSNAFSNSFVVAHILEDNLSRMLEKYNLEVVISPILDSAEFWDLVARYESRITKLQFNLIRPNMADISGSFKDEIRELTDSTNSLITKVELNAPKNSTLENINKENDKIRALAEYGIQGGTQTIHMKVKGIRKTIKTEQTIITTKIDSIELLGNPETVGETLRIITEE